MVSKQCMFTYLFLFPIINNTSLSFVFLGDNGAAVAALTSSTLMIKKKSHTYIYIDGGVYINLYRPMKCFSIFKVCKERTFRTPLALSSAIANSL